MNKLSKIDAGIIIVILTAFSYVMAYTYLQGYLGYYKLLSMFVEVNYFFNSAGNLLCDLFHFLVI
jgi:hypothetical protein